MSFPLYILLILYLVGIGVFLLWTFFNLYHIIKFGLFDFTGKLNTLIFVGFSLVIMAITVLLLANTPWLDVVDLSSTFSFGPFAPDRLPFDERL